MKCICPMGGDRVCPDNCIIAVWNTLPAEKKTKAQRKTLSEQLYQQNYTMAQIAQQLGVSIKTISKDLEEFLPEVKIKPVMTATNPKGAGRPKGKKQTKPLEQVTAELYRSPPHATVNFSDADLANEIKTTWMRVKTLNREWIELKLALLELELETPRQGQPMMGPAKPE